MPCSGTVELYPTEIQSLSRQIFDKVFSLDCYKNAKSVFIYNSFGSEVYTRNAIIEMLKSKTVYLPVINKNDYMTAVKINENTVYYKNRYGIDEPLNGEEADKSGIDLCITPGAVFDIFGGRTGYGKAYYDIFLRGAKIYKLAICYDFQLIDFIPVDLLDVNMDCIVTDKRLMIFK